MTRHNYRYARNALGLDDTAFEKFVETFRDEATELALSMGMFDPTRTGFTHPDVRDFVAGDCTVLTSRFNAAPGAMHWDLELNKAVPKRSDPDAAHYPVYDPYGTFKKEKVYGLKFGMIQGRLPGYEHEFVVLDLYHVTSGLNSEGAEAERACERLLKLAPGLKGIVYDMALRGKNREHFYEMGLLQITKVPQIRKGVVREKTLGIFTAHLRDGREEDLPVRTINGTPHVQGIARGAPH